MTTLTAAKTGSSSEKRRYPRVSVGISLDLNVKGHPLGRCRGSISDLSPGGMTFKTDAALEEGMCLHLKLPSSLQIRGEVRHMRAAKDGLNRYGIRFHKISEEGVSGHP